MKSCRLNSVALSWLQGGHHLAPQYSSTGLRSARACAKARSMSASDAACSQAIVAAEAFVLPLVAACAGRPDSVAMATASTAARREESGIAVSAV